MQCRHAASLSLIRFVVIMGTDTMAYAASAISFMLENLAKPVIFTGLYLHEMMLEFYAL